MSNTDFHRKLNKANEITLSVKGRKTGRDIPRPVWFVNEGNTLYLLPVQGSDTNWYKNLIVDPTLKISVDGEEISERSRQITDSKSVNDIVSKFRSKYGEGDVKKYYPKTNVAVEVPLQQIIASPQLVDFPDYIEQSKMRIEYEVNHKVEGKHVMQVNIHDSCGHIKSKEFFNHMKSEDALIKYLQSTFPCRVCGIKPEIKEVSLHDQNNSKIQD